ncbi:MAG: YbjN domain-containing protein [Acidobacteriota bacterium]
MSRVDVLRPFIEKHLASMLDMARIEPDTDGEYSFAHGSAEIRLRLIDDAFPILRLWAVLVRHVRKRAGLLEALNQINATETGIRVFKAKDTVVAAWELPAATLDERQFVDVCRRFARVADRLDSDVATRFQGSTARADDDEDPVDA